jgi:hypothetical protein
MHSDRFARLPNILKAETIKIMTTGTSANPENMRKAGA